MKFDNINDINDFLLLIRDNCDLNQELYDDITWFSTNKYTTSSEYFGELMLFLESIVSYTSMEKYRDDILSLINILKKFFG